jgi:hypothetical protein
MIFEAIRSGAWAVLSNKAKALYAAICYFVHENGGICSVRRLAQHAGISRRGVIFAVKELIGAGLILCRKGTPLESSQYELLAPPTTRILDERPACIYCGRPSAVLDHVIPQAKGGFDSDENLVPCCFRCNGLKGALSYREFCHATERLMWEERERELGRVGFGVGGVVALRRFARSQKIRLLSKPGETANAG